MRGGRVATSFDDTVGVDEEPITGLQRHRLHLADSSSEAHRQRWCAPQVVFGGPIANQQWLEMAGVDPGQLAGRHAQRTDQAGHVEAVAELVDHDPPDLVVNRGEAATFAPNVAIPR